MSIKQMARVWERVFTHPEQSVMLALADHADDHGAHIYPSIGLVAWKTGYSVRQVKRVLDKLRSKGVLIVVARARRGRPTEYRINLEAVSSKATFPSRGDKLSPQFPKLAVSSRTVEVTSSATLGDISGHIEPSLEPSINRWGENSARSSEKTLASKPTEVAPTVCQKNGWSGQRMVRAFKDALEFQSKQMPEASLEQVGEWLVQAYFDRKAAKGDFAGGPQKFFEQALYRADRPIKSQANSPGSDLLSRTLAQLEAD